MSQDDFKLAGSGEENYIVLGDEFLSDYYSIYDIDNKKFALVKASHDAAEISISGLIEKIARIVFWVCVSTLCFCCCCCCKPCKIRREQREKTMGTERRTGSTYTLTPTTTQVDLNESLESY